MSSSSGFDPILGRVNWEIPAEVRSVEGELRTAKQIDLDDFQDEVVKSIYVLQSIADDRLADFNPFPQATNKSETEVSPVPQSRQQEIDSIVQFLKKNLDAKVVILVSDLPHSAPEAVVEREKIKFSETAAGNIYDTEQIARRLINWKDIKSNLCPSLQCISDDVFDVTNTAISILAPLSIAGTLAVPLQPMLWGWIILIISRVGIKNFCRGYDDNEK
jgi:hypothetical protein